MCTLHPAVHTMSSGSARGSQTRSRKGPSNTSAASAPQGAPASASTAPPLACRSLATCFICLRLQLAKVLKLKKIQNLPVLDFLALLPVLLSEGTKETSSSTSQVPTSFPEVFSLRSSLFEPFLTGHPFYSPFLS